VSILEIYLSILENPKVRSVDAKAQVSSKILPEYTTNMEISI